MEFYTIFLCVGNRRTFTWINKKDMGEKYTNSLTSRKSCSMTNYRLGLNNLTWIRTWMTVTEKISFRVVWCFCSRTNKSINIILIIREDFRIRLCFPWKWQNEKWNKHKYLHFLLFENFFYLNSPNFRN